MRRLAVQPEYQDPLRRLAEALDALGLGEGMVLTRIPGVKILRSTRHVRPAPITYEPSVVIIAQGRKVGRLGDHRFVYDPGHYLVLAVPLPFLCETVGSREKPLLGISVGVSAAMVAELLLQMDPPAGREVELEHAVDAALLDEPLVDAALRLAHCLASDEQSRIFGPSLVREIVYRALSGPRGSTLRALAAPQSHFGRISRVLQRLHLDCAQPVDIDTLAHEAGMSPSAFHVRFKEVTSSSPLQYVKTLRLHRARQLMVHDGESAAGAAMRVGYESASQFSREFRRHFGDTPGAVTAALRASLTQLM